MVYAPPDGSRRSCVVRLGAADAWPMPREDPFPLYMLCQQVHQDGCAGTDCCRSCHDSLAAHECGICKTDTAADSGLLLRSGARRDRSEMRVEARLQLRLEVIRISSSFVLVTPGTLIWS